MSERLDAMLRIAQAASRGPWFVGEPDQHGQAVVRDKDIERFTCWHHSVGAIEKEMHANAAHIAAFNPTVAQALVKVAMAAMRPMHDGGWKRCRLCGGENIGHSDFTSHKADCALRGLNTVLECNNV